MSINIKDNKQDTRHTKSSCDHCPEVERARKLMESKNTDKLFLDTLNLLNYSIVSQDICNILKYYNSNKQCPCQTCLLKTCCSEDCDKKIKLLRGTKIMLEQENFYRVRDLYSKGTNSKDSIERRSLDELQRELYNENMIYEHEMNKYKKRKK